MTIAEEYRRGRHVVSVLHVHLVFVTKYRRGVLNADMLLPCQDAMRKVRGDFGAGLPEFNGEDDHAHLLAGYPPKVAVPVPVNSLNGSAGATAAIAVHWPREPAHHARALLVPVLLRRVLRRRAAEHHPPVHRAAKNARLAHIPG